MSLLIKEEDTFEVTVHFKLNEKGQVEVVETKEPECETEVFTFKYPAWKDVRTIIVESQVLVEGVAVLDPIAFIEAKVKTLLRKWSLKDSEGKAIPITKLDLIPARVMFHVGVKMDNNIGNIMGIVKEQQGVEVASKEEQG